MEPEGVNKCPQCLSIDHMFWREEQLFCSTKKMLQVIGIFKLIVSCEVLFRYLSKKDRLTYK